MAATVTNYPMPSTRYFCSKDEKKYETISRNSKRNGEIMITRKSPLKLPDLLMKISYRVNEVMAEIDDNKYSRNLSFELKTILYVLNNSFNFSIFEQCVAFLESYNLVYVNFQHILNEDDFSDVNKCINRVSVARKKMALLLSNETILNKDVCFIVVEFFIYNFHVEC